MLRCELPSSATQSFRSHWLTTEKRQATWLVASSYAPLRASPQRSCMVSLEISLGLVLYSMLSTSVLVASVPVLLCIQISSKLRRMTLSLQKAKAVTSISENIFFPCGYIKISQTWFPDDIFCLLLDRFSVTQAHDISHPNYMVGMAFKTGSVTDKGWSYSMPPKNVPTAGQGVKDSKKPGYDVGTRSPPGKPCPL